MSLGLVIYFAYSYKYSNLANFDDSGDSGGEAGSSNALMSVVSLAAAVAVAAAVMNIDLLTGFTGLSHVMVRLLLGMVFGMAGFAILNSILGGKGEPGATKPPVAAMLAIVGAIVLTIWQVEFFIPNTTWLDTAVRTFAWAVTGILVAMMMYGRSERGNRTATVRTAGLIATVVNLIIWIGIFYWFLTHWADFHKVA
jgi:hypothetical protein